MENSSYFNSLKPELFFGYLLRSVVVAKLIHLRTLSKSTHDTMDKYSLKMLDLVDEAIEVYQGTIKKNIDVRVPEASVLNADQHIKEMITYVESGRKIKELVSLHGVQTVLDDIVQLLYKTLYLLTLE